MMKNVFLDTNVLIDFMARRESFYENAAIIFRRLLNDKFYSHSVKTIYRTSFS